MRFEVGGYWLGQEPGSDRWYRYWYESISRSVRRRSLRTSDYEVAKERLVEWYTANKKPVGAMPDAVYLAPILESYLASIKGKPSHAQAGYASKIILTFFGMTATVADATKERQADFIRNSARLGHSVAYISRNLSVLSAAINHAELALSPKILFSPGTVAEIADAPAPAPRKWIPTIEQVGFMFDAIPPKRRGEPLFRFMILELNTGARPGAALELSPAQLDGRIINLLPPGRRQNKKHRPTIVATNCLLGWLQTWDAPKGRYVHRNGKPIASMDQQVRRMAENTADEERKREGIYGMYPYALRHFVATELRRRGVPTEERDMFMGHKADGSPMRGWYETFDPTYLANAVAALDSLMLDIQAHATRPLFAPGNNVFALKTLSK